MDAAGFDVELFIEAIKMHPPIWDTTIPEYHDKIKKRSAWLEVCSTVCDGFEEKTEKDKRDIGSKLMKKWKGMRDSFLKAIKKKTTSGQGASSGRRYVYARQMEFVLKTAEAAPTCSSIEDGESEEPQDQEGEVDDPDPVEASAGPSVGDDPPPATEPQTVREGGKKKPQTDFEKFSATKRRKMLESNLMRFMSTASEPQQSKREKTDEDQAFFDSLLPAVKTLPLDSKLEFRCRVLTLLKEMRASVLVDRPQPPTFMTSQPNIQPSSSSSSQMLPQHQGPIHHSQLSYFHIPPPTVQPYEMPYSPDLQTTPEQTGHHRRTPISHLSWDSSSGSSTPHPVYRSPLGEGED